VAETLDAVVLGDLRVEAGGEATRVAAERRVVATVSEEGKYGQRHAQRPGAIRGHDLDLLLREARVVRDLDHLAGLDMIRLFAGLDENRCAEIKNSRRLRAESSRRPPRHRRDAARWRGGAGPTHELIFAQPGVLPLPPRAASSAFTSATMRAMAASSAAVVILAARALAMLSLPRAAPLLRQRETNPTDIPHHPGELSGGPHPIYLHLLDSRGLVLIADLKSY
jgi:hypothetical protein